MRVLQSQVNATTYTSCYLADTVLLELAIWKTSGNFRLLDRHLVLQLFLFVGPGDCQNCSGSGSTRHVLLVGFAIKKMKK